MSLKSATSRRCVTRFRHWLFCRFWLPFSEVNVAVLAAAFDGVCMHVSVCLCSALQTPRSPLRTVLRLFVRVGLLKKFGPPPPLANDPHQHGHNCANLRTSVRTSDLAQKKHRAGAGWVYDRRQWHMVCHAPSATPGKKKSPERGTSRLFRKANHLTEWPLRWNQL